MTVVDIECDFTYEAAHWLPKVPDGHQCGRMHGHSYRLTVVVSGPVRDDGFVLDFAEVKAAVNPLIEQLDHHTLNDVIDNPTVENQLIWLWERIRLPITELRLRETGTNSARYRGPVADA